MEMELKGLIDKIRQEGVEQAEKDAAEILSAARKEAKSVTEEARKAKERLIQEGREQAREFQANAERAIKQAGRDVLLSLRERMVEFFDRLVKQKTEDALGDDILGDIIVKAVSNFSRDKDLDIEVLVNPKDRARLEKSLFAELSAETRKHITVSGSDAVKKGFRIGEAGKDSYVDFTDEAVAEALARHLNPRLIELLDIHLGLEKEKKHG